MPVILLTTTVYAPKQEEVNTIIREEASVRPNVTVLDWASMSEEPGMLSGDGYHPSDAGRQVMVDSIAYLLGRAPVGPGDCLKPANRSDVPNTPGAPTTKPGGGGSGTTKPPTTTPKPAAPATTRAPATTPNTTTATTAAPATQPAATQPPATQPAGHATAGDTTPGNATAGDATAGDAAPGHAAPGHAAAGARPAPDRRADEPIGPLGAVTADLRPAGAVRRAGRGGAGRRARRQRRTAGRR